jgi:hydrogenase maturation protease
MTAPVLIFAVGNEARGDDALAPILLRRLQVGNQDNIEFIEEYQLQVEHVTDLVGRDAVLFIDADASCDAPFHFSRIDAAQDNSYSSHAMSPFALLHTFRQVYGSDAPTSFLLRIRGCSFELGDGLSDEATHNLEQATRMMPIWLADIGATSE